MDERSSLADRFRMAAPTFRAGGAPLYAHLALSAARAAEEDEEFREALEPFLDEPDRGLLPHRLFAWMHSRVLLEREPELAEYYPSVGGMLAPDGRVWPLFRDVVVRHATELPEGLKGVNQHNEVGRAAALSVGFLDLTQRHQMPHRYLEVGASAGLLLRWDHYLYQPWYRQMFEDPSKAPMHLAPPDIAERRGCDLDPIDPTTPEGVLRLRSFIWADLDEHMRMLNAAIAVSRRVPATVDRADGVEWLDAQLGAPTPDVLTVVYLSLVAAPQERLDQMAEVVYEAGARATRRAPLAYLALHVADVRPGHPVRCQLSLATFPGHEFRTVVTCDINGRHVR
jgi:hypothetical protein